MRGSDSESESSELDTDSESDLMKALLLPESDDEDDEGPDIVQEDEDMWHLFKGNDNRHRPIVSQFSDWTGMAAC